MTSASGMCSAAFSVCSGRTCQRSFGLGIGRVERLDRQLIHGDVVGGADMCLDAEERQLPALVAQLERQHDIGGRRGGLVIAARVAA